MSYKDTLQRIDELLQEMSSYGKFTDEILKRINYKFRLEWNYTSNSMEGNSLTMAETRSVMVGNITVDGKPLKDILEIKGHDDVITAILKTGKGEANISEKRIKDIHTGIMNEEDPVKRNMIGKWKTNNNYLFSYKNERIDFAPPSEVPDLMHKLINWVNTEKDKISRSANGKLHPAVLAFRFHTDFVTIHPFYDGNGRMARILTNIVLIAFGYPPLYIKENERSAYYRYLADIQLHSGEADLFYEYMAELLMRSVQLQMDALQGKDI